MARTDTVTGPFDVLLGVPTDCTGRFAGCQLMPAALRAAGIVDGLGVDDAGNLQVVIADPVRDPDNGVVGLGDWLAMSAVIRDEVTHVLSSGRRPLLLGGDCTLLIGVAAAMARSRPDAGLLFVDGHLDCYTPETSSTGEGADMEMAALLGVGPEPLVRFSGRVPTFLPERVVVLGPCDEAEAASLGAPDPRAFAPDTVIVSGAELARDPSGYAQRALDRLADTAAGFWLHVDLDVLSADVLPAVDYPNPHGIDADQLCAVLTPILASENLIGASIVILNPTLDDETGSSAGLVVDLLTRSMPA